MSIDWIIQHVRVKVRITPLETDRILTGESSDGRVKVPEAKTSETRNWIVSPARVSKRLKARIGIRNYFPPSVVVDPLRDRANLF